MEKGEQKGKKPQTTKTRRVRGKSICRDVSRHFLVFEVTPYPKLSLLKLKCLLLGQCETVLGSSCWKQTLFLFFLLPAVGTHPTGELYKFSLEPLVHSVFLEPEPAALPGQTSHPCAMVTASLRSFWQPLLARKAMIYATIVICGAYKLVS